MSADLQPCRLCVLALLVASHVAAQQPTADISGIWQFTMPDFNWSATVQITQSGAYLLGQFTPIQHLTPAFTGTIGGGGVGLIWNAGPQGPPRGVGEPYIGSLVPGGTSIQGYYYDVNTGRRWLWSAVRLAGLGPAIAAVANAASGATGPIAPGEIISLYAHTDTNPIGPTARLGLQLDESGNVATSLGGVRVHFLLIDTYAPLTFVSAGQINAVVPYEVAGLATAAIRVEYLGQASEPFPVPVKATAPAIFTANGSGTGPGAILNHDGTTLNGPGRPEPRGGVVVVFVTGEGQTTPPGVSGRLTTMAPSAPLTPVPLATVEVRINGQSAPILFLGEAPTLVAGVLQLNVQVPLAISPGNVPIQVLIGGVPSQNGVSVTVQ